MPVIKEEADEQTIFDRGEFAQLLEDLTFNSREIIGKITNFARLKRDVMTKDIHEMLTAKLREAPPSNTLPYFYAMDSILKNIGDPYKTKFQSTLIADFKVVFTKLDIDGRRAVYKLRTTWNSLYSLIKLHELDNVMQRDLDSNWPVVPLPSHLQDKTSKPSITYTNPKIKTEAMKPSSSIKEKLTAEKKVLEMQKQLAEKDKQIQKLQRENQRRSTPVEDLGIVREKDKKKKKKKEKKSQPDNLMQQDLSNYRKGKIVEKTVEARYTKTVQHRPDPRLKSLPRVDPKKLQMDEITPKTGQLLQSLGKKDQQVFTIPAESKVKHIPVADAVKNASKEKLYLHARNLFTTNKITKDQYDNLINTIKVMKDAADKQLANGDKKAPLIVPFKDIRGGDATIKAEIDVDVDEPITDQKRREDRERERKEKYRTNDPLSMNVSDSDDSDEITEITPSGAVARKLVREKLQRDKRDKNDKSGKRSKPPKQLPLVPPRGLGPPKNPPNFLTKQEIEPERVNMDKLLSNLQKTGVLGSSGPIIFGEEVSLPSEYTALDEKRARLNAWANKNKGKVKQGPAAQPTSSSPLPTTSDALEDILTRMKDYSLATNDEMLTNYRPSQSHYKDLRQVITYFRSGKLCPNTGIRFPKDQEKRYHSHLDWYFLQNKQKEQEKCRPWYLEAGDWLSYNELKQKEKSPEISIEKPKAKRIDEDFAAETFAKKPGKINIPDPDDDVPFVPDTPTPVNKNKRPLEPERPVTVAELNALKDQCCAISGEPFQTQYDEDTEEWLVKDCVIKNGKAYNKNNLDDRELKLDKSIIYDEEDSTPTPKPPKKKIQKLNSKPDSNAMSIDTQSSAELPSPEFKLPQAPLTSSLSPKPVENSVEQKSKESINPESISMSEMDLEADNEIVQIVENGEKLKRRESVARLEEDAPMPRTPSPVASEHSVNELRSPTENGNLSLGLNISAFPMPVMEDLAEIDAETQRMVAELAENPESIEILQEPEEVT